MTWGPSFHNLCDTMRKVILLTLAIILTLTSLTGIVGLGYWEFIYDIQPKEALEYYNKITLIPDEENGAFALAGVAAPPGIDDLHTWGKSEVEKNLERSLSDDKTVKILSEKPGLDNRLFVDLGDNGKHFVCWMPDSTWEGKDKNCMDEESILNIIDKNRQLIERYKKVFSYSNFDLGLHYNIGYQYSISLSKLLITDYWFRKNDLSEEDISIIFKFFRFWENSSRNESLSMVNKAITIVNYGIADSLLMALTRRNPLLLEQYHTKYGNFFAERTTQKDLDSIIRAEFKMLNSELCLLRDYRANRISCKPIDKNLTFKPGRTIEMLYENRPRFQECEELTSKNSSNNLDFSSWARILMRPGNFRGRTMANLFLGGMLKWCDMFDNLNMKIERNALRNLYLHFKLSNFTHDKIGNAYQNNKNLFRIEGTNRYFGWDQGKHLLVWKGKQYNLRYEIPYLISTTNGE